MSLEKAILLQLDRAGQNRMSLQCYSPSYKIVYVVCDNCIVYTVHVSKWNAKQLLCEKVLRWAMSAAQWLVSAVMMW